MIRFIEGNIAQILSQSNANDCTTTTEYLDKNCILLTEGSFKSMDGDVTITAEHLNKIAETYRNKLSKIRAEGREPSMADYHPAQLDHSTSARDTVGRLIGPLLVQTHNGKQTLFGVIRFLGCEAVEKVSDGRWTHLSVGINSLETCELDEITITPFPACKDAILFSSKGAKMEEKDEEKKDLAADQTCDDKKELSADKDEDDKKELSVDKDEDEDEEDEEEKKVKAKKKSVKAKKKLEEEDDEAKENKTKLSAALVGIRTKQEGIRLAIKQSNIKARLSKLKAEAKITPAELKKIDLIRLAKSNDETLLAVLESYENRQPVLHTAIYGSVSAVNPATVAHQMRMSALEKETRARFASIPKKEGDESNHDTAFADIKPTEDENEIGHNDLWDEIVKSIKTGKESEAKEMYRKMRGVKCEADSCESTEMDMKKLMSDFASLETELTEVVRLATITTGIKI